jgi:hypothetical protein
MVSGSRASFTFILSDHPHRPSRHFAGVLPFRLPYAVRQPLLRIGRKLMVGSGLFLLADAVLLIWLTALALIRGALGTSMGAGFVAWLVLLDIALLGSVSYALGPEPAGSPWQPNVTGIHDLGPIGVRHSRMNLPTVTQGHHPTSLWDFSSTG